MEVSEFMEIHEFSFADRKLQSGPIARQINIQHNLIPTQEPKETIDLVCTEINGKTPRVGLPRRSRGSRTPELLHIHPSPASQKLWNLSGWAGIDDPTPGLVCSAPSHSHKALWGQQELCAHPQVTFGAVFSMPLSGKKFSFIKRERSSALAGAILAPPDLIFHFSFKHIDFFICLIPRRSCGTSFTFQGCLRGWNNSELWVFSWSWAGPASSMSPASAEDRGNVASLSLLGQLGA